MAARGEGEDCQTRRRLQRARHGRGCFPERGTSPQPRRMRPGLPTARPHWRCRANVWRGI